MTETEPAVGRTRSGRFATFHVGEMMFGIGVERVQEVVRFQEITPVPLAPPVIRGLMNLRGQLVTAIDTRVRLNVEAPPSDRPPMNMVIRAADGAVSLLVDEIGDVIEVSEENFEPPPENLPQRHRELLDGIYKLEGKLLLILSPDRVLERETRQDGQHR